MFEKERKGENTGRYKYNVCACVREREKKKLIQLKKVCVSERERERNTNRMKEREKLWSVFWDLTKTIKEESLGHLKAKSKGMKIVLNLFSQKIFERVHCTCFVLKFDFSKDIRNRRGKFLKLSLKASYYFKTFKIIYYPSFNNFFWKFYFQKLIFLNFVDCYSSPLTSFKHSFCIM